MKSFEKRKKKKKMKAYPGIVVPLVLNAMRKAQTASIAMDSRGFGVYKTRTWLEKSVMKKRDYLFLTTGIILFMLILMLNYSFTKY
jgi:energy-coupling factor transport system permease protein